MAKKSKLATPDWIREGYDSKEDWEKAQGIKSTKKKGKTYKIKECPSCNSRNVSIVLSGKMDSDDEESSSSKSTGEWKCSDCGWIGLDVSEKELNEDEFLEYLAESEDDLDDDFGEGESKIIKGKK